MPQTRRASDRTGSRTQTSPRSAVPSCRCCRCRHRAHDRACPSATVVGVRCGKSGSGCCRACLVRLGVVVQHATGSEERPAAAAAAGEGGAMRIAVYGAGGVGGYFGGRLAQAGADVHLIARGAHLQVLRTHGLRVRSVKGDFAVRLPATDDPADVGPCDYVLFCVKAFDTEPAAVRLGPLLGEDTAVVSLQNGVDNEEKLARVVRPAHVMGGAAFIFAGISEPGVIVHTGGPTTITFGELDGRRTERAQRLLACYQQAGVAAELSPAIKTVLWAKLAFICAQAGMTAAARLPIGEIRTVDAAWAAFQRLVAEVAAVAEADGTPVPPAARNGPWPWHRA